jgi:hypothetical protein
MELYAVIDLHANSHYLGIIDGQNNVLFKHKIGNDLKKNLNVLEPFRSELRGVVVESTAMFDQKRTVTPEMMLKVKNLEG